MVNTKKWFERIKKEFNLTCDMDEFIKIYYEQGSKVKYYSKVVEFAHHLKSKCKVGILSNLMLLDRKRIDSQVMLDKFDYIWLSFEMGCKKPSNEIYQKVEEKCKMNPEQILFIDDTLENILAAKKRGWQTIQATGYAFEKIKKGVHQFLDE